MLPFQNRRLRWSKTIDFGHLFLIVSYAFIAKNKTLRASYFHKNTNFFFQKDEKTQFFLETIQSESWVFSGVFFWTKTKSVLKVNRFGKFLRKVRKNLDFLSEKNGLFRISLMYT